MASAITAELQDRNSSATWYVAPLLYGVALIPGVTRMYKGQHWASDVVSGAFLGTFMGDRVVHYAHSHERSKLDRVFLGASIMPSAAGGATLAITIQR
jgi:hypothetical protein